MSGHGGGWVEFLNEFTGELLKPITGGEEGGKVRLYEPGLGVSEGEGSEWMKLIFYGMGH